jgi:hypothetical protein
MNIKLLAVAVVVVLATACVPKTIIKTEYVEKKVPVPAVPAPPQVEKPVYETSKLTEEDRKDIGKVTQAVTVEAKQKDGYIVILEMVINKYKELADKSEIQIAPMTLPAPEAKVEVGEIVPVKDELPKP